MAETMQFFDDLKWRGLVYQTTDEALGDWLKERPRTLYAGFDPTADSLHVGSLLGLIVLRRFQKAGHKPIAVVGGATGMIGDPSGKSDERQLLDPEKLRHNVQGIGDQMRRFLDFDAGPASAKLLNNIDWTGEWTYLDFLRDIGKNCPVNVMLARDSVKNRLAGEAGMSYTEFSYALLQAFDFVHLQQAEGCELQAGGSDQWGNITAGIDLARRMHGKQLYGLTWPLLTKSDGTKMGKSESGAIWLSADRTSPYEFFQYWRNVDDADVGGCLRMLTDLSREQIESLDESRESDPSKRESQVQLAEQLTLLVHGADGLAAARKASDVLFGAEITGLSDKELVAIFADVPSAELPRSALSGEGLGLLAAFCSAGLAKSNGEARRTVQQGGAYVNNRRRDDPASKLTEADLASETVMVLRAGKKRQALLRFTD